MQKLSKFSTIAKRTSSQIKNYFIASALVGACMFVTPKAQAQSELLNHALNSNVSYPEISSSR